MTNTNLKYIYMSRLCYITINYNINCLKYVSIPQYQLLIYFLNLYYRSLKFKNYSNTKSNYIGIRFYICKSIFIQFYNSQFPRSAKFYK